MDLQTLDRSRVMSNNLDKSLEEIIGYKTKYRYYITSDGHVFVERKGQLEEMQQESSSSNYMRVTIGNLPRLVHRLVATAWVHNPNCYPVVNHLDEDKTNNSVENLEWTTQSGNMKHFYRNKLYKLHGSLNVNAKLTEAIVADIKQRLLNGVTGTSLAREFGVAHGRIYDIKHGRGWTHVKASELNK